MAQPPRLELIGIGKQYPAVKANDGVNLTVAPGQIHAVLGENGAGKSTLMKIIYGAVQPDEGEVRWNGQRVTVRNPHEARALGISMVFQHFSLFDTLTGRRERVARPRQVAVAGRGDAAHRQGGAGVRPRRRSRRGRCTRCRSASASAWRSCARC